MRRKKQERIFMLVSDRWGAGLILFARLLGPPLPSKAYSQGAMAVVAAGCRLPPPFPFQPSLPQSPCSQRPPLRQRLRTHSSSLSCCKHEEALSTAHMAHCLSSSPSCSLSSFYQTTCKGTLKRSATVIVFAEADSDQSQSSHEELGEGTIGCCCGEEQPLPRKPNSEIKPGDVVQVQLRALREQDFATLFEFASPKNKAHTGPLSRFTEMIQGRAYSVMLGHSSAKVLSTLSVGPDRFQQRILIEGPNGKQAVFSWSLSRQGAEPFQDCWMTDSVHRDEL